MGLEQRIDLLSPLNQLMHKLGEGLKSALPGDAKVKVELELEPTPLQEVEAAIERTKAGVGTSPGGLADAQGSLTQIQRLGDRFAYLLKKIESGNDITGNAALEVERLEKALDRLVKKGKEAATAVGDEGLAGQIEDAATAVRTGQGGHGRGGATADDLENILRNPSGAGMQKLKTVFMDKFGEPLAKLLSADLGTVFGGGMGVGGIAAGAGAALGAGAAGFAYGWHLNTKWANEATGDAEKALRDARFSYGIGNRFDLRGKTFDDRLTAKLTTKSGMPLNNEEVRRALSSMGVGVDNWRGDAVDAGMDISTSAIRLGASTDQIGSMVGAAIRSGTLQTMGGNLAKLDDNAKVHYYLSEIAGSTKRAADLGVASNETLSVIASMSQKSVTEAGFMTFSASRLNLQAMDAMNTSGDRILQGQSGMNALQLLGGNGSDEARAREADLMYQDGDLMPEYRAMIDGDPVLRMVKQQLGEKMAVMTLLERSNVRQAVNQRGIRKAAAGDMPVLLAARRLGLASGSTGKDMLGVYAALQGNDILSQQALTSDTRPDVNTAQGKETMDVQALIAAQTQTQESRTTAQEWGTYQMVIETNLQVRDAVNMLTNKLSSGVNLRMD